MKQCIKCKQIKTTNEFYHNKHHKDGLQTECKPCQLTRKKNQRSWLKGYKSTLACEICGESCVACLDFHHVDANNHHTIATMAEYSIIRVKQEISKCRVLCANCHRKEHAR